MISDCPRLAQFFLALVFFVVPSTGFSSFSVNHKHRRKVGPIRRVHTFRNVVNDKAVDSLGTVVVERAVETKGETETLGEVDKSEQLESTTFIFEAVARRAAECLVESDLRRDAKAGYSNVVSSSATNWINDATAFRLQQTFDRIRLQVRGDYHLYNIIKKSECTNIFTHDYCSLV